MSGLSPYIKSNKPNWLPVLNIGYVNWQLPCVREKDTAIYHALSLRKYLGLQLLCTRPLPSHIKLNSIPDFKQIAPWCDKSPEELRKIIYTTTFKYHKQKKRNQLSLYRLILGEIGREYGTQELFQELEDLIEDKSFIEQVQLGNDETD